MRNFGILLILALLCARAHCQDAPDASASEIPTNSENVIAAAASEEAAPVAVDEKNAAASTAIDSNDVSPDATPAATEEIVPDEPLQPLRSLEEEEQDTPEEANYLKSLKKDPYDKDECHRWHDEAENIKKALAADDMVALTRLTHDKNFMESQLQYLAKQVESQRQECARMESEGQRCDPHLQLRISHTVDQLHGAQKTLNDLLPRLSGEDGFRKQQYDSHLHTLMRHMRKCPGEVMEEKRQKNREEERKKAAVENSGQGRLAHMPKSFGSVEEMHAWLAEHDPELPKNLALEREAQQRRDMEELRARSEAHLNAIGQTKLVPISMGKPVDSSERTEL